MNLKKMQVTMAAHFYEETIAGLYDAALLSQAAIKNDLAQTSRNITDKTELTQFEKDQLLNSLGDDLYIAELTTVLASEMMIIAPYKSIEIAIKRIAGISSLFTDEEISSFYQIKELRRAFRRKVSSLDALSNYAAFDELRLINN